MGREHRWTKVETSVNYAEDEALREMGCPHPNDPSYYSYLCDSVGDIKWQRCVGLGTSLNKRGAKSYKYIQHHSIGNRCSEAQEVLCCRTPHGTFATHIIVTRHYIGECPLSNYHTEEEYENDVESRRVVAGRVK